MSHLIWTACSEAGPLASLPLEKLQDIAPRFRAFCHTFECFRQILRHQHIYFELYDEFQQTWDECIDFLYHNPAWNQPDIGLQPTVLHKTACYVYNSADEDLLERRLMYQLHIMNAKIDDIILNLYFGVLRQSNLRRRPQAFINGGPLQYDETVPSRNTSVELNTLPLFRHLVPLDEALKRREAPPLSVSQLERLWHLITARFREHELPSQGSHLMFSRNFQLSDVRFLREYSQQSLRHRLSAYPTESLIPTIRRRVYFCDEHRGLAVLRLGSEDESEPLYTLDVVTRSDKRWIVSIGVNKQWRIIQHLPAINDIHPYTKHQDFKTPDIWLFEPCDVHETDGSEVTYRYKECQPLYRFDSPSIGIGFQCALRGKILQRTFQVEAISSGRNVSEGTAQPLKLWSDFDGQNWLFSFLSQHERPYYHIDVPLRVLRPSIRANESSNKVRVELLARTARKKRGSMTGSGIRRRLSDFFRPGSSLDQGCATNEPRRDSTDTLAEDELPTDDTRFLTGMTYLRFEFSTSHDAKLFQDMLANFFSGIDPPIAEPQIEGLPSHPTSPRFNPIEPGLAISPVSPPKQPGPSAAKVLDYRVRGINLDCSRERLLSFLHNKLNLEPEVIGRIKSLATDYTSNSQVAVISWRPRPACLSVPNDEWIFGPSSDDDDIHITVDTHFRGVTILYSPPPGAPHTVDICAVAGLGGHAWGSFKHKGTSQSFMWIRDALPKHLPFARLMTYGSKTKLDGNESTQSLEELGMLLRSEMRNVTRGRSPTTLSSASARPGASFAIRSFFIAHSLGGLTVKAALLQEKEDPEFGSFINNLHGALFFGVPSHGMNIEALEAMIRGQPNEHLVKSISYNSQALQELSRKFRSNFAVGKPKIIYFYEKEPSCTPIKLDNGEWKMEGTPKKILVDEDSATDGEVWVGHVNIHPLNRNHSDLVKFSSPNDGDFQRVLNELIELVKDAEAGQYEE